MRLPAAVVFDFDGTVVDSETVSRAAMAAALAEDGHTLTDADHDAMVGQAWPATRDHLVALMGYDDAGIDSYRRRVAAAFRSQIDEVVVFDDVRATLGDLAAGAVPVAICTSSGRAYLDRLLSLRGLGERVAATVAREDTDEHKPRPAPYLLAARRLGVDPEACVVVEDTPTGIAAARAAGMRVVAVDRGLGLDLSAAHAVVTEVSTQVLRSVAARQAAT